jgi:hypothetical protein
VLDLVAPHVVEFGHDPRKEPLGHRDLRGVNAYRPGFSGVVDLEDTPHGELRVGTGQQHFGP